MNPASAALPRSGPRSALRRAAPGGAFERLGRLLVRHPWYPVALWIVVAGLALPFLSHLGGAQANSATTLPASAPSAEASRELAQLFPNDSSTGSNSVILLQGTAITDPVGQNTTIAIADRIASDPGLADLEGVSTLYSSYAAYLSGLAGISGGVIAGAQAGTPTNAAVNATAALAWGAPGAFLDQWESLVRAHPTSPPSSFNAPAFQATASSLAGNSAALGVLDAFYGAPGTTGWNGTNDCAAVPAAASACATALVRSPAVLSVVRASGSPAAEVEAAVEYLGLSNYTNGSAIEVASEAALVNGSALPLAFVELVRADFPTGEVSPLAAAAWADPIATLTPVSDYPLPIPPALASEFVDAAGDATVIEVGFSVPAGYTDANGSNPVFADVQEIDRILPSALRAADPSGSISAWQTGDAALNAQESSDLAADLAIVLPLTVVVLVGITMVYFRSPITPLVTFGTLGIALVLSLVGVVALGAFVTKVDPTALTLATTFVLGVGTDYSVFLVARYREELLTGADPKEAVVTSVAWAGQSIATSGATAILATLALAFSGVGLLSQWGMVLSLSVLLTLLASLTLVPAVLALVGPRILWPDTGRRFQERARAHRDRVASRRTYFYRAAARSQRRPLWVLLLALGVSAPLFYVAIETPLSYNFYAQLPGGEPASNGLHALENTFGPGYAFPSYVLVTFRAPLLSGDVSNATEFTDLAAISSTLTTTPGAAGVASPVGPRGAPLSDWTAFSQESPLQQTLLRATLSPYLGNDGRTVWLTIQPTTSGLSVASVSLIHSVHDELRSYASSHSDVTGLAFGGGAQTTADLEAQTALATERMVAAVTIGLLLVLFVVLRSYWIPPMAVATIGLSIGWAWAITYLVVGVGFSDPIFYFVPTILFLLILGLGIDYNIFLLTRVREERWRGRTAGEAASEGVARTGGIITAAAIILASAFGVLTTGRFLLLQAIGFSVAVAILLDAMVVRTYLVPALLHLGGERIWAGPVRRVRSPVAERAPDGRPPGT